MRRSCLLHEWAHYRRAYLIVDAAAVCADANAVVLHILPLVSFPCLRGCRVDVDVLSSSPRRSDEAGDLLLRVEAPASLAIEVVVDLLP